MKPTLKEGDLIIYKPFKPSENVISEGNLVVLEHPLIKKALMVKRVSEIYVDAITVMGDNESTSIDSRQFGQIHKSKVKGIVEKIFPL